MKIKFFTFEATFINKGNPEKTVNEWLSTLRPGTEIISTTTAINSENNYFVVTFLYKE